MEEFYCVSCSEIVTTRQEALLCDGCERWQHRRCGTGITRETYRRAVREGVEIPWKCLFCKDEEPLPIAESTMIDTELFNSIVASVKLKRNNLVHLPPKKS
ncbi:hypothetical protein P5673_002652 [Acropora cervicornis]|uniref:PHD-type domain-containing protein n=1 Tax=Acropora cervicornis TaxID=6130 RepID=A0AAD9R3K9_ACRCE|nr:hypothetical protein P5673_002652 [Acropora cervicornis]